jgi:hypothetical protein
MGVGVVLGCWVSTKVLSSPAGQAPPAPVAGTDPKLTPGDDEETVTMPQRFFWIALIYLALVVSVFILFYSWRGFRDWLPDKLGPLPIDVPWFAALGGCVASLTGIFDHNHKWKRSYDYWHYSRPFVAGVVGSVGTLLFYVIATAADEKGFTASVPVFAAVAFLIGYREATFRELIKRATDLLLKPADTPPASQPVARQPDKAAPVPAPQVQAKAPGGV